MFWPRLMSQSPSSANALTLHKIACQVDRPQLPAIRETLVTKLQDTPLDLAPKSTVAIAVGSRGIANLATIVRTVVENCIAADLQPFLVPAMGSHGGATAEGQTAVLASYGITEASMGCPVNSSMDVVELDSTGLETPLYLDRHAHEADGIILINRIKPHTDFHGPYESGLIKMAVIGLGKERQAFAMHRHGVHGLKNLVPQAAQRLLATGRIKLGIGIIENAYDETAFIEVIPGDQIWDREAELIRLAHTHLPRLPVDAVDILGVDQLGKDISGTGLDTNVIGRIRIPTEPEPERPRIKALWVGDLTAASHGNATGMGLADVITERFRSKIDHAITYTNIITSGFLERAKQPIVAPHDQAAFELCHRAAGPIPFDALRIIRIRDTLHVNELYVSSAILKELGSTEGITVLERDVPMFDTAGNCRPF